jgi:hypothetical protein
LATPTLYASAMQPIIRRTITITITETWTITWPDGRETFWEETHEVAYPADGEPGIPLPPIADDEKRDDVTLAPSAATPPTEEK